MSYLKSKWYGWISEDDYLWGDNRYLYSENVNTTENAQYIELYNKPIKSTYTTSSIQNLIEVKDYSTNTAKVYAFCHWWKVYRSDSDTLVYENSSIDFNWLPAFTFAWSYQSWTNWDGSPIYSTNRYIYFITSWSPYKLNRTTLSSWGSPELNFLEISDPLYSNKRWVVIRDDIAVIWIWESITVLTHTEWAADSYEIFNITQWEEIAWITYSSWYFRIYTVEWRLLLWDWVWTSFAESVPLSIKIEWVYQYLWTDYIFSWYQNGDTWLYYMNWYSPVVLFKEKYSNQLNINKFRFNNDYCWFATSWNNKIFFIDAKTDNSLTIWMYWSDIQWLPSAYNIVNWLSSSWNALTSITNVCYSNWFLYYSYFDWVHFWIDKINFVWKTAKSSQWILYTNINDLQDFKLKTFKNLYFRVDNIDNTHYIELYKSINWWTYNIIQTINETPLDWVVRIPSEILWEDFRDCSFMFKFYSNSKVSPRLYNYLLLEYDIKEI